MTERQRAITAVIAVALLIVAGVGLAGRALASQAYDHPVSEQQATWTPVPELGHFNDGLFRNVFDLTPHGGVMYACGKFTEVHDRTDGSTKNRSGAFAFNPSNGAVSESFHPDVHGTVFACRWQGGSLILAGDFDAVDGVSRKNLARVDADGTLLDWTPKTNRPVRDIVITHQQILLLGAFTFINATPRVAAGSLNLDGSTSGYLTAKFAGFLPCDTKKCRPGDFHTRTTQGATNGHEVTMLTNALTVNGHPHTQAVKFSLDADKARLAKWNPKRLRETQVQVCGTTQRQVTRGLDYSPSGKRLVIVSSGGPGDRGMCDSTVAFSGSRELWHSRTRIDTLNGVADTGKIIYASGHQTAVERVPGGARDYVARRGIQALRGRDGVVTGWRSDQPRCIGGYELQATSAGLWAGMDCEPGIVFRSL